MVAGNSETGVPLGLVGLFPKSYTIQEWASLLVRATFRLGFLKNMRYIIVEMGIDDPYPPKNMEYLLTIVKPDIGIITEESAAHAMQFEKAIPPDATLDEKEKLKAIVSAITHEDAKMVHQDRCTMGIINGDNPFLRTEFTKTKKSILTFGTQTSATIQSTDHKVDLKKTSFSYSLTRDTTKELVTLNFAGFAFPREMSAVFAPAVLAAYHLSIPLDDIKAKLEKNYIPPRGREGLFEGVNGSVIIDSTYNASRPSVISFLELVASLKKETGRHTVVVLADMLELGNVSQVEHEAVAHAIGTIPDTLYLVGPLTKRFVLPIVEKVQKRNQYVEWFPTIVELNKKLAELPKNSLILFKGSQGDLWLEESIKLLLKNKSDVARLCRQNAFWKRVKTKAGRWIEV